MPPPRIDRRARGALVEDAARRHLREAGLREVAANANYRGGELDLVMLDPGMLDPGMLDAGMLDARKFDQRMRDGQGSGNRAEHCVVFVEVRYRSHAGFGGGAASINASKRRKLVHAAQLFLASHRDLARLPCRFDVVEADGDPAAPRLTWLRDAFRADDV